MDHAIRFEEPGAGDRPDVRLVEEARRESENRFRAVFESSNDAIFLLTEQGFVDCNPMALHMFAFPSKEEALRAHPGTISPPLQPDGTVSFAAANEHIAKAFREGVERFDWMHRRVTGEDFPAEVLLSAFEMSGRTVLQATVRDITRRRTVENALRAKNEEMDRFFQLALDLLCIAGTDGYFRRLNTAWEKTLGWSFDELMQSRFLDFVHPDDVAATLDAVSALSEQEDVVGFVNRYRCKDGSYRWIEWRSAPAGDLIYAAARDITDHIAAEESLRELNESLDRRVHERTRQLQEREAQLRALNTELETRVHERTASLEEANRELEAFSYSVSHDLRAPLRHINGFVELLQRTCAATLDEKSKHWLQTIADSARDMGRLIDELLVFSRMARADMLRTDIDLRTFVDEVRESLAQEIGVRRVEWLVADLPVVRADPMMLKLVVMNLLQNAVKYTRQREVATIAIECIDRVDEWEIVTRDNGAGFDMKYADKLFGVFQRLHSAKDFEGTGIGLANVQRIVKRHGGRVWAEGRVDEGASFSFTLPKS